MTSLGQLWGLEPAQSTANSAKAPFTRKEVIQSLGSKQAKLRAVSAGSHTAKWGVFITGINSLWARV